jgi:hypothetical protein
MRKVPIKRPSAAMIVAVVALSLSLVGTGVAATISLSKGEKQTVRKIVNQRISKQAPNVAALANVVAREGTAVTVPAGGTVDGFAKCNQGEKLVGGGSEALGIFGNAGNNGYIQYDGPDSNVANQWKVKVYSAAGTPLTVTAYCQKQ